MGRNARRRAARKDEAHEHGAAPPADGAEREAVRCPKCGSANIFVGRTHPFQRYLDVICGNCNWQGELPSHYW